MHRCLTFFVPLLMPTVVAAQSARAHETPTAVSVQFAKFADMFGSRLVAAFDSIPAERYDYRPARSQQTVGYIAQHLENANYSLCEQLSGAKHPKTSTDSLADSLKARWPKDTLIARLDKSLRFCDAALDQLGQLDSPAVLSTLLALETDLAEHYSQISVYMRLLGLVPPSALPPNRRIAIALPPATLAPYAGEYEVARGLDLIVAQHNDTLTIRSTPGGATVRLWPENATSFFVKELDAQVTFTHDHGDTVTGLIWRQYGRDRRAIKTR